MKIFNVNEDWDYLVVLDGCRYDFFAIFYKNLFEGILEKRFSRGIDTPSWFKNTFTKHYDNVIYISGNPYVNSQMSIGGCDAWRRFFKVIDVWKFGWDDELGTVPPWTLTLAALSHVEKYAEKKFIIHYLQPHAPYISKGFRSIGFPRPDINKGVVLSRLNISMDKDIEGLYEKLAHVIAMVFFRLKVVSHPWLVLERLKAPPASPMDAIRRIYGVRGLRRAYLENLKLVLEYVALLVDRVLKINPEAKIIVTADHGELLGEDGLFGHGIDHPLIRIVPWFRVKSVKKTAWEVSRRIMTRLVLKKRLMKIVTELHYNTKSK